MMHSVLGGRNTLGRHDLKNRLPSVPGVVIYRTRIKLGGVLVLAIAIQKGVGTGGVGAF